MPFPESIYPGPFPIDGAQKPSTRQAWARSLSPYPPPPRAEEVVPAIVPMLDASGDQGFHLEGVRTHFPQILPLPLRSPIVPKDRIAVRVP